MSVPLSEHFSLDELIASETAARQGIDNTPGVAVLANLYTLAAALEYVRLLLGHPIHVNSGYRSPALNHAVGGAANSAHVQGLAADIICPEFGTALEVCQAIADSTMAFDQLIYEFASWAHVAIPSSGMEAKRDILTITSAASGYMHGLPHA